MKKFYKINWNLLNDPYLLMSNQEIDNVAEFMKGRFTGPEEYRSWCHTKDRKFLEPHLKALVGSEIYDAAAVARDVIRAKKKSEKLLLNEKTIYPGGAGQDSYK